MQCQRSTVYSVHSVFKAPARILFRIAAAIALAGCSDSIAPDEFEQFTFREEVTASALTLRITSAHGRSLANQLLQSGEARWVTGRPVRGDGGFNTGYSWHLDPATISFAEVTIEACQTAASAVADDLDYWIGFGQVCIWGVVESRN